MPAQWLSHSSDIAGRANAVVGASLHALSRPGRQRQLRWVFILLLSLWAVFALARLVWSLLPAPTLDESAAVAVINPLQQATTSADSASPVDIQRMVSWHLFGEAGAVLPEELVVEAPAKDDSREGIEKGARETRLEVTLRGIVASTESGLGHAVIEHNKRQAIYAVEDKLPVSGEVVLAKVMPRQVVLDNGGTYELLTLFEDSAMETQLSGAAAPAARQSEPAPRRVERRDDENTSALARGFRDRLYQDPQSLAEVVSVSAVRSDGQLRGYRVSPGKQRQQFEQLGFKQGDLVTGINGIALNDPANTMRLYQTMRTASEAVFELERGGQALSISVQLDSGASP